MPEIRAHHRSHVHVTVVEPYIDQYVSSRVGICQLTVETERPLPRAPYSGTVRLKGAEASARGLHEIRLLRHYEVVPVAIDDGLGRYRLEVDLSDDPTPEPPVGRPPVIRRVNEPVDAICKRIAGLFGRYCEAYRPPSVSVRLED